MSTTLSILVVLWLVAITALVVTFYSILSRKLDSLDTKIVSLLTLVKSVSVDTGWIQQKYSALQTFMQDTISAVNKLTVSSESNLSLSNVTSAAVKDTLTAVNETSAAVKETLTGVQETSTLVKDMSKEITTEYATIQKSLKRIESLVSSVPTFYDETGHPVDSIVFAQGESSRKVTVVGAAAVTTQDSER